VSIIQQKMTAETVRTSKSRFVKKVFHSKPIKVLATATIAFVIPL
jgi:hypothetical protein